LAQARLVKITYWRVPAWLYPFGMLLSQIIVNLLLELGDGVDRWPTANVLKRALCAANTTSWTSKPAPLFTFVHFAHAREQSSRVIG
jgi:hypothetical protein